jgi:hypothetical protein
MKKVFLVAFMAIAVAGVSCSSNPMSPTSPTGSNQGASAANADGSTLKVTAPGLVTPFDTERITSRRPTMVWQNASGVNAGIGLFYELELWDTTQMIYSQVVGETPGTGSHTYNTDLAYDRMFSWRIRAGLENERGPWSAWGNFMTPFAPVASTPGTTPPVGGTIGPPRVISFNEAFGIIVAVHNGGRFNLGRSSSRDYRVAFLDGAVAVIHYGHARYNPQGPDTDWCVKDAGGGRPQSDDVLARCSTREAWDLIVSAGGDGYSFHADYLGRLPGGQNVFAPSRSSLNFIGQ